MYAKALHSQKIISDQHVIFCLFHTRKRQLEEIPATRYMKLSGAPVIITRVNFIGIQALAGAAHINVKLHFLIIS